MKFLILFLWFLPGTALAQKDYCKQIEKDNKNDGSLTYKSPRLKNFTVVKEAVPPSFALLVHFKMEYKEEVGYGIELELEDGTILKDDAARIYYHSMNSPTNNALLGWGLSNDYIWYAFFRINAENVSLFINQRIVKARLQSVSKTLTKTEGEKLRQYINCMSGL